MIDSKKRVRLTCIDQGEVPLLLFLSSYVLRSSKPDLRLYRLLLPLSQYLILVPGRCWFRKAAGLSFRWT